MPPSARSVPGVDGRVFVRNTVMNIGSFHIVPTQPIAVIVRKIKQTYSKREHFSSSPYYEPQAPARWPAAQNNSTICHTGQDLTGHPWSVRLGSGYNKNEVIHFNLLEDLRDLVVSPHQFSCNTAHVLRTEVMSLLAKGALEAVSPAQSESGFYSRYFLLLKNDGGLRPILNLRHLNSALMKRLFRMITL